MTVLLGRPAGYPQGKVGVSRRLPRLAALPARAWDARPVARRFDLAEGGVVVLDDAWLDAKEAAFLFAAVRDEVAWRQERIRIHGRECMQPRLVAWFGDP